MKHTSLCLGGNWQRNEWPDHITVWHTACSDERKYVPERVCKIESWYDNDELEPWQEHVGCTPEDTFAYRCTRCGGTFRYDRGVKPNYCPICGARVIFK